MTDGIATRVERLRFVGLTVTRPRLLILACLDESPGHMAAEDILHSLALDGHGLPRATVYNVLHDLVEAGVAMQADVGPGRALYEVAEEWHHHFVCGSCQRVIDVPCLEGDKPCLDPGLSGVYVEEAQVILRGRCQDCRAMA